MQLTQHLARRWRLCGRQGLQTLFSHEAEECGHSKHWLNSQRFIIRDVTEIQNQSIKAVHRTASLQTIVINSKHCFVDTDRVTVDLMHAVMSESDSVTNSDSQIHRLWFPSLTGILTWLLNHCTYLESITTTRSTSIHKTHTLTCCEVMQNVWHTKPFFIVHDILFSDYLSCYLSILYCLLMFLTMHFSRFLVCLLKLNKLKQSQPPETYKRFRGFIKAKHSSFN